ncbi:MAG: hypothetical protein L0K82_03805 [Pisciglobus halotolerans]|nr:hypothetical protein [Pisciglobus halotolerans]
MDTIKPHETIDGKLIAVPIKEYEAMKRDSEMLDKMMDSVPVTDKHIEKR